MAHSLCLQDWITISGGSANRVTQAQKNYLDISGYADVAPYVEISNLVNGAFVDIQEAPDRDEPFFGDLVDASSSAARYFALGVNPLLIYRAADSSVNSRPPARFIRWSCSGSTGWTITFRVWLSLNQARSQAAWSLGQRPRVTPAARRDRT